MTPEKEELWARINEIGRQRDAFEATLRLHRFRPCDIAACNCGSWHAPENVRAEKAESERDAAVEALAAARAEHVLDLKEARTDRDSMKTWSVALFAHVCRLTGRNPKDAPREIRQLAEEHEKRHAEAAAETIRVAGARVLEALQLAEEELDLVRRELTLGGSEPDDGLELTYGKVAAAIKLLEPK